MYAQVVEYFGENPKTLAPNTFFSLFVKFVQSYKVGKYSTLHSLVVVCTLLTDLSVPVVLQWTLILCHQWSWQEHIMFTSDSDCLCSHGYSQ